MHYQHVVAGALLSEAGEVLISQRPDHVHQGGKWEFPGGKVESGETAQAALARELNEELGLTVLDLQPLIQVRHRYPDQAVWLEVWKVTHFAGAPRGMQGQPVRWIPVQQLNPSIFPAADRPVIAALQLPTLYLITPEPDVDRTRFMAVLEAALISGVRLVRLRARHVNPLELKSLSHEVMQCAKCYGVRVLVEGGSTLVHEVGADGVHLSSRELMQLARRPLPLGRLVAASVHTRAQMSRANEMAVDFVTVSPVAVTSSHPGAEPLGWRGFAVLCESAAMPAYALGGMTGAHVPQAIQHGGQGIAAIRGLWPDVLGAQDPEITIIQPPRVQGSADEAV